MFGYIIQQMQIKHPQVMTSQEIARRLHITYKSALLLKRRVQLFASDLLTPMRNEFYAEMKDRYKDFRFPTDRETDLSSFIKDKAIPQTDTVVLFSCSTRANKGRKRFKRKGQTSSIYMSEKLGGHQVGTMVSTLGIKGGPVFYDSVGDQKAATINPIITKYIPTHTPLFSDMGYKGFTGMNHRMVNHSARSADKRYRYAKNRWSKNGVHCNVAEGNQGKLKRAFAAYTWISPKFSQLYLNEYAFFHNARYFTEEMVSPEGMGLTAERWGKTNPNGGLRALGINMMSTRKDKEQQSVAKQFSRILYEPKTLLEIQNDALKDSERRIADLFTSEPNLKIRNTLKQAFSEYESWRNSKPTKDQRRKQRYFESLAAAMWQQIPTDGYIEIQELSTLLSLPTRNIFRILEVWYRWNLIELVDLNRPTRSKHAKHFDIQRRGQSLVPICYVFRRQTVNESP
jgi:hypothetical protein